MPWIHAVYALTELELVASNEHLLVIYPSEPWYQQLTLVPLHKQCAVIAQTLHPDPPAALPYMPVQS
jgi:hypothetical protein